MLPIAVIPIAHYLLPITRYLLPSYVLPVCVLARFSKAATVAVGAAASVTRLGLLSISPHPSAQLQTTRQQAQEGIKSKGNIIDI